MGDVVPFIDLKKWPPDRPGLRKPDGPWRAIDLKGRRPAGHRTPELGAFGRIKLAIGQVWVEVHTQELYVIRELNYAPTATSLFDVVCGAYKQEHANRILAEAVFRYSMKVWDQFEAERRENLQERAQRLQNHPESFRWPLLPGFDEDGYRID